MTITSSHYFTEIFVEIFCRLKTLSHINPRNISTVAKELFKTAFCIKPRIIQGGLNFFGHRNRTKTAVEEMETLVESSKIFIKSFLLSIWTISYYNLNRIQHIFFFSENATISSQGDRRSPKSGRKRIRKNLENLLEPDPRELARQL